MQGCNRYSVVLLLLVVSVTGADAAVLHVPADYPTIQQALNAAQSGDVVWVAPGTYFENLAMPSDVVLESQGGAEVTTIEAPALGSVISMSGASPTTVVKGFHLTGGSAEFGGAIRCWDGSSPLIEENIIAGNQAVHGAGIAARYESFPVIRSNRIEENDASFEGGGIYAIDGSSGQLRIDDNDIDHNSAGPAQAAGGGVWCGGIDFELRDNRIHNNSATSAGGGIWAGFSGLKLVSGNVIFSNSCPSLGGGIYVDQGQTTIIENTLYGNSGGTGGAVAAGGLGTRTIDLNILAGSLSGGGIECLGSGTTLRCNDLWGNAGGNSVCGTDLGGNIAEDPRFCGAENSDFTLESGSPCLPPGNSCGATMGALGEGCGGVPIERMSWGTVKEHYRR